MFKTILMLSVMAACTAACTTQNPALCCETADECAAVNFTSIQPCSVGACVKNKCVADGTCDGPEDCMGTDTCVAGVCTAPVLVDAGVDSPAPPDGSIPPEMTQISGGPFLRGCDSSTDTTCGSHTDETPSAMITISTFYIDSTEVTQSAYKTCIDASACTAPASGFDPASMGSYPVEAVTWQQAVDYCTFKGKRLPTEAEWEKAARGVDGRQYPWGNADPNCTLAQYLGCPLGNTSADVVGSTAGDSPYGVKDMGGNVTEWTNDWYSSVYYQTSPTTDPQGPATGTYKLSRGGAWGYGTLFLRASNRYSATPTYAGAQFGFRCAKN